MLLIASEASRGSKALTDVVREMSFSMSYFSTDQKLAELMVGESRRILLLTEDDITDQAIKTLQAADNRAPFGVIIAADGMTLAARHQARQ